MKISGLQKMTLIDYPGKIACTVFLAGCNYRCGFCHNPELVCPEEMAKHSSISPKDLFDFLADRKDYLEGVCVSGGEPTINPDLPEFFQKIKSLGYKIKLDTNGSNPKMLGDLINDKLIDFAAMDIKAPKEKYAKLIGLQGYAANYLLNKVEESVDILKKNKIDYEFRTTFVPNLLKKEDILKIADWLRPAKKYVLQNFRPEKTIDVRLASFKPYENEMLVSLAEAISPFFGSVEVR